MAKIAVIGLGTFGFKLAVLLEQKGAEVMAIDIDREKVEEIKDLVSHTVRLDATDEIALRAQGVEKMDQAVVCIGDTHFEANILASVILKQMGLKVIGRYGEEMRKKVLLKLGVDNAVNPEEEAAVRLSTSLLFTRIIDYVPLSSEHGAAEVEAPPEFYNKTLKSLDLRIKYNINVVAIRARNKDNPNITYLVNSLPGPDTVIEEGQILVVVGQTRDIERLTKNNGI